MMDRTSSAWLCALVLGCAPPPGAATGASPKPPTPTARPSAAAPQASASTPGVLNGDAPAAPWVMPEGIAPGELYLAAESAGVLRLQAGKFVGVLPEQVGVVELAVSPGGSLLASGYGAGTVWLDGAVTKQISKQPYGHLVFRSERELWATPDPFEWAVHRFDGEAWSALRQRADFKGRFSDNKLNDLAVTQDAVWVSSWNGLFRKRAAGWERVDVPESVGGDPPRRLIGVGDQLVARFDAGYFVLRGADWAPLAWPADASVDAVSSTGFAVGTKADVSRVLLGRLISNQPPIESSRTGSGRLEGLAVDAAGRIWLAGEHALVVLDSAGKVLERYGPGTLDGVSSRLTHVAVTKGGPLRLPNKLNPLPHPVRGKITLYKSGAPLSGARVDLCSAILGCSTATWKRSTRSAHDGSFRFDDALPGQLYIHVQLPPGLAECESPFTSTPPMSVDVTKCPRGEHGSNPACDIGSFDVCEPFEMPPPRP